MSDTPASVARQVFACFQAHDLDGFRALLADDAVLTDPSSGMRLEGPKAIAKGLSIMLTAFPDLDPDVVNLMADGDQAVVEVVRLRTKKNTPTGAHPIGANLEKKRGRG